MPSLLLFLTRDELQGLQIGVIVEAWDKRTSGRAKRSYLAEFTESERRELGTLYALFYRWYLVKGYPEQHNFQPKKLELIRRAVNFFATI